MNVFAKTFALAFTVAGIGAGATIAQAQSQLAPNFYNTEETAAAANANADFRANMQWRAQINEQRTSLESEAPVAERNYGETAPERGYGF